MLGWWAGWLEWAGLGWPGLSGFFVLTRGVVLVGVGGDRSDGYEGGYHLLLK